MGSLLDCFNPGNFKILSVCFVVLHSLWNVISHPVNSVYTQSVTIRQPVMVLLRVCIGGLAKCRGDVARCIG